MKLSCLQENLSGGVSVVSRSVATKGSLPVLSNILLQTEAGRLKLSATNLETGIVTWVGAKIEKEGALTIPARILSDLISSLGPGKLDLQTDGQVLTIEAKGAHSKINGMAAEEFPTLPVVGEDPLLTIDPKVFSEAVGQVAFAAAADDSRPILTGILIKSQGTTLTLVAVDGFRLSERKITLTTEPKKEVSLVIPARTLGEVARLVSGDSEPLHLYVAEAENQVIFKTSAFEISSRLLEGEFPDYEKIIPKSFGSSAAMETTDLMKAVRLAAIFAKDSANIVKLKFLPEAGKIVLSANTAEVGENETELESKVEGEAGEIAFNAKYLVDCLSNLDAEKITIHFGGPLSPGLVRMDGREDFLHLVMPVRIQS